MKRISVLLINIGSILAVHALNVECEAGLLSTKIDNPGIVSELVLTGSANAADFYFIDRSMPELRSLDMSGLAIAEYTGDPLGAMSHYKAGEIPAAVFAASKLNTVVLPRVCSVGDFALAGSSIANIVLPAGTYVGDGAFTQCKELQTVTVNEGVAFGSSVFSGCAALAEFAGSEKISTIPAKTFEDCKALVSFKFAPDLKSIGEGAFARSSVRTADMESCSSLASVGAWAFAGSALESVSLPAGLSSIGQGAFFECASLADISFPENLKELPAYALKDVTALDTSVVLPENLSSIGEYALMGVSGVTAVELPASLETIGEGAMEDMTSLNSIDAMSLASVPSLGDNVWAGVDQAMVILNVEPSVQSAFESTPQWQDFDIQGTSTSEKGLDIAEKTIRAAFDGNTLLVRSTGEDIDNICVYDVSGIILVKAAGVASQTVGIDTSRFDNAVFIVDCALTDGTRGTIKIIR